MQVVYHFCSKNIIQSRHKRIQPFPVKLHKNAKKQNNSSRAFIKAKSAMISSKYSGRLLFPPFLFSSKLYHITFPDLLFVNEARRYERTSFSLLKNRSQLAVNAV